MFPMSYAQHNISPAAPVNPLSSPSPQAVAARLPATGSSTGAAVDIAAGRGLPVWERERPGQEGSRLRAGGWSHFGFAILDFAIGLRPFIKAMERYAA